MNLKRLRVIPVDQRGTLYNQTELFCATFKMAEGHLNTTQAAFSGIGGNWFRQSAQGFLQQMTFLHGD
jgi:hypothetical protein